MSKRVIMLRGLPASGKSAWCKELLLKEPGRYKRISKDDLRSMLDEGKWSKASEAFVLKLRDAIILQALADGYHPLIDDTNLHPKHEQAIRELVKGLATVEIKDFTDVPLDVCLERDRHRVNYVGEAVIRKMYRDFLQIKPQPPIYDPDVKDAIICDIDGTLALINGRNPYDAALCESDLLNSPVADIIKRYSLAIPILLVSGRKEEHREQTERWLQVHHIQYTALWMRRTDDSRKDVLVKEEIYKEHIEGQYNVKFVIDDRSSVVQFWRSLGLTCFQVAEGDF